MPTITQAFNVSLEERRERWSGIMKVLRANDTHNWTRGFIRALQEVGNT
ncbi:MAG: hypothetical protein ACRER0_01645 [Gammaproteobacteria bacterium]